MIINRFMGPYRYMYWGLLVCNVLAPQALWFQRVRASTVALMIVCMFVNVGMWLERYIIVVVSLSADFLPASWGMYAGTRWDWATYVGSIGLFLTLFFLFIRFLPMISIFEMRTMLPEAKLEEESAA
jgi:molybdopterin-containing oxidoreductase family membrane subunit